jgi:hypothetical protein
MSSAIDGMADQDAPRDEGHDPGMQHREGRGTGQGSPIDAVDGARCGRDLDVAGDQALEGIGAVEPPAIEMDRGDLDHPGAPDVEARGLGIDRDATDRKQRRGLQQVRHAVVSALCGAS